MQSNRSAFVILIFAMRKYIEFPKGKYIEIIADNYIEFAKHIIVVSYKNPFFYSVSVSIVN